MFLQLRHFLYRLRGLLLWLLTPLLRLYRLRYRHIPTVKTGPLPVAEPLPLQGYTDRVWYLSREKAIFYIDAAADQNLLLIERMTGPGVGEQVLQMPFGRHRQATPPDASENGCRWSPTLEVEIDHRFRTGYYRASLLQEWQPVSYITFMVQEDRPQEQNRICVFAPVSTWAAYNPFGGKSLYHHVQQPESVYFVSLERPNTALQYHPLHNMHATEVEINIFNWLNAEFGADLYPDYLLEKPELFTRYRLPVLSYHCEYFSEMMYRGLRQLVQQGKSLLSLGANQIFWQVRWHHNHTRLECRKDATAFSDGSGHGGTWRQTAHPEEELLGARFTDPGTGTYAPYRVLQPHHWLFQGTGVTAGQLFGHSGISPLGLSGDETDKSTFLSRPGTTVLARGMNKAEIGTYDLFEENHPQWQGQGGGEICLRELSEQQAILNTGSIQSGSGLGTDAVLTQLVRNFVEKFG